MAAVCSAIHRVLQPSYSYKLCPSVYSRNPKSTPELQNTQKYTGTSHTENQKSNNNRTTKKTLWFG